MRSWFRSALMLGALAAALAAGPAFAETQSRAVHAWVTTPDGTLKLADQGATAFRPGGSPELTISVDPSRAYQPIDGFGASITDSSASVLYRLDPRTRAEAMSSVFPADGLSVLRQPMGASDFVDGPFYTYDDVPAGR